MWCGHVHVHTSPSSSTSYVSLPDDDRTRYPPPPMNWTFSGGIISPMHQSRFNGKRGQWFRQAWSIWHEGHTSSLFASLLAKSGSVSSKLPSCVSPHKKHLNMTSMHAVCVPRINTAPALYAVQSRGALGDSDSQTAKGGAQSCCDAQYLHVHCERCGEPSQDAYLCIKCFYAERE